MTRTGMKKYGLLFAAALTLLLLLMLSACGKPKNSCELYGSDTPAEGETLYTPGSYTAEAWGFGGNVTVEIEFSETDIRYLRVDGQDETDKGVRAIKKQAQAIMEAQSPDVDAVSGATMTSAAIQKAARSCFEQAASAS